MHPAQREKGFPVHPVQFEIIIRLNSEGTHAFKQGRPLQALHSALSVGQEHSATNALYIVTLSKFYMKVNYHFTNMNKCACILHLVVSTVFFSC